MKLKYIFIGVLTIYLISCKEKNTNILEEHNNPTTEKKINKSTAFNETFLTELETIRKSPYTQDEQLLEINNDVTLSFPSQASIRKLRKGGGVYILTISDSLVFDASDENLVQYQVKFDDETDGVLNILPKPQVNYDFKETIADIKENQNFYGLKLIDTDNFGYIYEHFKQYHILRYFKINDNHYTYSIDFNNLKECVQEFDRSKKMIR